MNSLQTIEAARIAVVMPNWVGDACMASPMLHAIRDSFRNVRLVGVMSAVVSELYHENPQQKIFDERILFHKKARNRRANSVSRIRLVRELRQRDLQCILLLPNSFWSASVAFAAGVRRRVGYARDGRSWLLTDRLTLPSKQGKPVPTSAVDSYLELARWIGCEPGKDKRMRLYVSEEDHRRASELWFQAGFSGDLPTVVINSNSAKDASRVWPAEQVRELALRLAVERNVQVLLHCGPAEREFANQIAKSASHPKVASMGIAESLPLGLSRGVLDRASVVVSTDSGARHMAVALERPVVSLFGSTDPRWTRTYNLPEVEISLQLDCQPCYQANCPFGHQKCMKDISVQRVLDATFAQLKSVQPPLPQAA